MTKVTCESKSSLATLAGGKLRSGVTRASVEATFGAITPFIREYFDHFQSVRSAISDGKCTEVHFQKPSGHFTEVKWP